MTDKEKLDAIRAEIHRLVDVRGYDREMANDLFTFMDSLPNEPVSKVWHYQKKEPVNEIADKSRPIIVVYGNNSLNAAGKFRYYEDNSDAIWLSNSYEKWAFVEDLINLTHSVTKVSWQQEPVSEDLEKAAEQDVCEVVNECSATGIPNDHIPSWVQDAMVNEFIHGAKWQKEQMMAKGVDGVVHHFEKCGVASVHYKDPTGVPMSYFMSPKGIFAGDKVKIIVIKEAKI